MLVFMLAYIPYKSLFISNLIFYNMVKILSRWPLEFFTLCQVILMGVRFVVTPLEGANSHKKIILYFVIIQILLFIFRTGFNRLYCRNYLH